MGVSSKLTIAENHSGKSIKQKQPPEEEAAVSYKHIGLIFPKLLFKIKQFFFYSL